MCARAEGGESHALRRSQVQGLGKISAALQTELVRQKYDPQKQKEIQAILKRIEDAKGTFFDKLDQDDFVKSIAKEVASYRGLTLSIDKSKDSLLIQSNNPTKMLQFHSKIIYA